MKEIIYYQRGAEDPILENSLVLDIVRQYKPEAKTVSYIDESGGEARTYAVDEGIILKVQRPQQLRSFTSLEKEVFFLKQLEKETDVSVPRVLGYGKRGSIEYICMTRMPGIAAEKVRFSAPEKEAFLFELGKELRSIHSIDQKPFIESGLFPSDEPPDLKERLRLRYQGAIQKKKEIIGAGKLESACKEVERALEQIHDTDKFVALHVNPYIPHVFADEKAKRYTGIIDFGDSYISHPIFDMWYWNASSREKLLRGYIAENPVSAAFMTIFDTVSYISRMVNSLR